MHELRLRRSVGQPGVVGTGTFTGPQHGTLLPDLAQSLSLAAAVRARIKRRKSDRGWVLVRVGRQCKPHSRSSEVERARTSRAAARSASSENEPRNKKRAVEAGQQAALAAARGHGHKSRRIVSRLACIVAARMSSVPSGRATPCSGRAGRAHVSTACTLSIRPATVRSAPVPPNSTRA